MPRSRRSVAMAVGLLMAVVASGCGGSSAGSVGRLQVVAAENFYGDLVRVIGGRYVAVTSIVTSPNADPHLFEPGSRAGLAVANASVVVRNGVGYDDWMERLLQAARSSHRSVLTIATVLHVTGSDPNPHLWYDAPALPRVAAAIGGALAAADHRHAAAYRAGVSRAVDELKPLETAVAQLKAQHGGAPVAYTERVPGLLLAAAGLRVLTPPSFARAVENGTDPSPADVAAMQRLISGHRVKALLYNEQATSATTLRLQRLARAAAVPIVAVTETVPAGKTFIDWQLGQVLALAAALSS